MKYKIIVILSLMLMLAKLNSEPIQDFTLPDINNQNVSISEFIGEKLIVIDFWASWCAPCMRLLPELEKIHREYDQVEVITISIDNPRSVSRAKSLIRSQRYSFLSLYDTNQEVMNRFQVTTVPHTFLINIDGEIVYEHSGYSRGDEEKLITEIEKQLVKLSEGVEETLPEDIEE